MIGKPFRRCLIDLVFFPLMLISLQPALVKLIAVNASRKIILCSSLLSLPKCPQNHYNKEYDNKCVHNYTAIKIKPINRAISSKQPESSPIISKIPITAKIAKRIATN